MCGTPTDCWALDLSVGSKSAAKRTIIAPIVRVDFAHYSASSGAPSGPTNNLLTARRSGARRKCGDWWRMGLGMCRRVTSSDLPGFQAPFEQRPSASRLDNNTARSSYELGGRYTLDEGCSSKTAPRLRLRAMPRARSQQRLGCLERA